MAELPEGFTEREGRVYNKFNQWVEKYDGKWTKVLDGRRLGWWRYKVLDGRRLGWWRYHEHYDRDGYCDNPARGY